MHEDAINVIDERIEHILEPNKRRAIERQNRPEVVSICSLIERLKQSKMLLVIDAANRKGVS